MEHQEKESAYQALGSECVLILVEELLKADGKEEEIELQSKHLHGITQKIAAQRS